MPAPLALVTGASGGIGEAIAYALARRGHDLALTARSEEDLTRVAANASGLGAKAHVAPVDLSSPDGVAALVESMDALELEIDVLVNNAGYGLLGAFVDSAADEQMGMVDLNVRALTELTHIYAPQMARRKRGGILNVASVAAFLPGPNMAVYYASKAFVLSFSEALHQELKPSGVAVTALCPGPVKTGFMARAGADKTKFFKSLRMADADDVARQGVLGLLDGKRVVVPGVFNKVSAFMGGKVIPHALSLPALDRLQR